MATPSFNVVSPSLLEVRLVGTLHGSRVMTVLHYAATFTGGSVDGWAAYTAFQTEVDGGASDIFSPYFAVLGTDYAMSWMDTQWIWPTRFIFKRWTNHAGDPGTGPSASLPAANSGAIIRRGTTSGRHGRGTLKIPAVPLDFATVDSLTGPGLSAYGTLADALTANVTATVGGTAVTFTPNLFNRADPSNSQAISGWDVREALGTERRRLPGRGI
jgi:hypothetical protein